MHKRVHECYLCFPLPSFFFELSPVVFFLHLLHLCFLPAKMEQKLVHCDRAQLLIQYFLFVRFTFITQTCFSGGVVAYWLMA